MISAHAFLRDHPDPSDAELREGLSGNLCRCTGYQGIMRAVRRAVEIMNEEQADPELEERRGIERHRLAGRRPLRRRSGAET